MTARLEHTNITVSDSKATAAWLCDVFGWHVRWQGASIHNGHSIHVGSDDSYIALYNPPNGQPKREDNYQTFGTLNHIAVFTDDIDGVERRVKAAGFVPGNHADYAPGRRFYFDDADGIEWEVASHQQ